MSCVLEGLYSPIPTNWSGASGAIACSCSTAILWRCSSPPATTIRPSRTCLTTRNAASRSPSGVLLLRFNEGKLLLCAAGLPSDAPVTIRCSTLPSGLTAIKLPSLSWPSTEPSSGCGSRTSQRALSSAGPADHNSAGGKYCVLRVLSPLTPPATRNDPSCNRNTCAPARVWLRAATGCVRPSGQIASTAADGAPRCPQRRPRAAVHRRQRMESAAKPVTTSPTGQQPAYTTNSCGHQRSKELLRPRHSLRPRWYPRDTIPPLTAKGRRPNRIPARYRRLAMPSPCRLLREAVCPAGLVPTW